MECAHTVHVLNGGTLECVSMETYPIGFAQSDGQAMYAFIEGHLHYAAFAEVYRLMQEHASYTDEGSMNAPTDPTPPTTQAEIKAAYKALYMATANAMDAQRDAIFWRDALKKSEAEHIRSGATDAGKNAETRAAILADLTSIPRLICADAENDFAEAQREQALAKIAVDELLTLLRLTEWELAYLNTGKE